MSKNKHDGVYSQFYHPHAKHAQPRYRQSPSFNKKEALKRVYWRVLTELSLNRFKWEGLPDSVDVRYLELSLMRHGGVLFFDYAPEPEITGSKFLVQQFISEGKPNHYDNPTRFRVTSHSNIQGVFGPDSAVPIWGNYLRQPDHDVVELYVQRLVEIDVTTDVNVRRLRSPYILVYDEDAKLSMANFDRQIDEGVESIKINSTINPQSQVTSIPLAGHHETIPAVLASKGKVWNEALMMMGVATANQDKKERMITQEVEAGHDQSEVIRNIALNSRELACEQINKLWPELNVKVSWRSEEEQDAMVNRANAMLGMTGNVESGGDSGDIHSDTSGNSAV